VLETTVGELFDKAVKQYPDKIAVKDHRRYITYAEIGEEVNGCANALFQEGIQPGDRVALWMQNCIEYIVCDFAIAKLGAVRVPLNTFLSDDEVAYRLEDAEVKAVICDSEYMKRVQNILQQTSVQPMVIAVGNEGGHSLKSLIRKAPPVPPKIAVGYEDLAAIMYTGGRLAVLKGSCIRTSQRFPSCIAKSLSLSWNAGW
jgi:acyl-CoA synthetase (AMP-forming)/AMP-acid ligase II